MGKSDRICPKCSGLMVIKGHNERSTKHHKQKQYFTQWEYCLTCRTIWLNPKFLVITDIEKQCEKYQEDMDSLFKNL